MKKIMFQTISAVLISITVSSCGNGDKKTDTPAIDTKTDAKNETPSDAKPVGDANQSGKAGTTVELVKAMVQKDWKAVDGQEATVTAYPKGMEKQSKNGEFLLYLSDSKDGSDLNFAASFKEELREEVKKHKGDVLITVTGNISTPNGIIALKNAKIVE